MNSQILQLAAHVLVFSAMSASAAIRYVNVNSVSPMPPYNNWTTAAATIQDAVDAAVAGDQILVTNGVYGTGGWVVFGAMTNRVAVNKAVTVQSVNGAAATVIQGSHVMRCVYLTNDAVLVGFTLTNGVADYGGGVRCESARAVLSNCVLAGNSATGEGGGGAYNCTLNNCNLNRNSATGGGSGGGAYDCTLNNCTLNGNSSHYGGGASGCTLNNCTVTGNSASRGGGAFLGTLNNCIVYYNHAGGLDNYSDTVLNYSCTTPLPPGGVGNISAEPLLADLSHLSAGSPCRGAGSAAYATGLDIDGETWANPPSIGCDEYHPSVATGPLSVSVEASDTNVAVGFVVSFAAAIDGHATANRWDFGDATVVSNQPYASHSWAVAGDYSVVLQAYNDTYQSGISATLTVHVAAQPVHYVALGSANPVSPYASWATAANNIQDAVDVTSLAGALVLVTNGIYQTGGRVVFGAMTNRVAVNKPVTVQSVNGAAVTVIRGFQVPGLTNGDSAIRCVYLTNGAALVGFTLTNGATKSAGDYPRELLGGGVWCESASAVVSNCMLTGNSATDGGGAIGGTLNNCTVTGNSGYYAGGGAVYCTLNNCTLTGNSATGYGGAGGAGGGAYGSTLNNCTLGGNSSNYGGGAASSTVNNSTLTGNWAYLEGFGASGGGASDCTLNNCTVTGNSASYDGGGASDCTLNNCTVTGNSASYRGGGASDCTLNNCIVYYNGAPNGDNYSSSFLSYSCTTPLPPGGVGNISAEPQLADLSRLRAGSPCRAAGSAAYATGRDIDGETWANPPSIGCDEYYPGAVTGPLSVSIQAVYTNVVSGLAINFTVAIAGRASGNRWEFGDGAVVSNRPYASHTWAAEGDYLVVLQAYNDTYPGGVSATVTVHVVAQPVHYVAVASSNPVAPYTSWATAATNIQDAVDAVSVPGALVLVSNGVYQTGERVVFGTMTNRVVVDKLVTVQSVNGAAMTMIQGDQATRCVFLANGAALVGFTLTNGVANGGGGGVRCESPRAVVSNCVLTSNRANGYSQGGGAAGGTLNNCTLTANYAPYPGGGASDCTLNNCTLARNSTFYGGGGASGCTLNNCALFGNSSTNGYGGGAYGSTLANCTLDDNSASDGGGAWHCTLNNCTVTGNSASYGGGGASGCTLNDCILASNSAYSGGGGQGGGGGASDCTLNNCTIAGNWAYSGGGGAIGGTLNNCIVYYNSIDNGQNSEEGNYVGSVMSYSCTTPLPSGIGNLTKAPLFVDYAGGNLHLQSNSPCINAGSNASAPDGPDLDGNPRIAGGTVDIGAYEFQSPQSLISYAWLQQYSLLTDGSADVIDADADGLNNWQEWRTGTNPTNALSVLRLLSPASGAQGVIVNWQSVSGLNYFLERGTDLGAQPSFLPLATDIVGQPGTTTFTDTNAVGAGPSFYRVGVQE